MEDLLHETFRVFNDVRKAGVSPASIRAVMGSREAVFRLARRMPGAVRKTGLPLDVLAMEFGVIDGEALFHQLLDCPRRSDLIQNFNRELNEFCGTPNQMDSFFEATWPGTELAACPF
jgi:hypothetical protein